MKIVFFCQSCGSRFDVDERLAGKTGACRKCGQRMTIPQAQQLASMVAMPALATAAREPVGAAAGPPRLEPLARARPEPPSAMAPGTPWSSSLVSQARLAPLTMVGLRRGMTAPAKPDPLDDATGSALYAVVASRKGLLPVGRKSQGANVVKMLWRKELGGVQKVLRWLSDTAYLLSVPFLVLILVGAGIRNRPLALLAATVVIALNVGRLATGLFNMVVIHFRESPVKGVLFLIPPLTVYYLATGWGKMQKSVRRVVEPAVTIGLVVAAFLFIPWLRRGGAPESGSLAERVRAEAGAFEGDLRGEVEKAKHLDLQKLGEQGQAKLNDLQRSLGSQGDAATPDKASDASPAKSLGDQVKGLEDRIRKQVGDIQKEQP